jgi:uncharacterized protein (TIGR02680 family)
VTSRWRLNRAGILNVYQYGDETLHFAGGRLLLRGVNGSGKSTAMNMLLPFLIDADTRRIDAAGEQSAVLRSWMLSGRAEQQPVGYLWVEFARTATDQDVDHPRYLVCGCGIKANRSTDRVTTWWFVTDRRPGIDLALIESRVPLSVDVLRAELGPHAVFSQEQRAAYRQAVRDALFGGRDLDQHIRLLHIVRSPRVGDRIDTELPAYLRDALPQLSEEAIDDAAQPLEDLEEHRRNVDALARTSDTLQALMHVYRGYATAELVRRASHLSAFCDEVGHRRKEAARRRQLADQAGAHLGEVEQGIRSLSDDIERLDGEIAALLATPAYQQGVELDDLRAHVHDLERQVDLARQRSAAEVRRRDRAVDAVRGAGTATAEDQEALRTSLAELAQSAASVRLTARIPDLPAIPTEEPDDAVTVPAGDVAIEPLRVALGAVQAAAQQRRIDVDDMLAALDRLDARQRELSAAEEHLGRAQADTSAARQRLDGRRHELTDAVAAWRADLRNWLGAVVADSDDIDGPLVDVPDLLDRRNELVSSWFRGASAVVDRHQTAHAQVAARRDLQEGEVARLQSELDHLRAQTYPEPPAAAWQRADRRACLADLVDFADAVAESDRSGLEAALEASGLLGAELGTDGALHLANGDLVIAAGEQVDAPLSNLLIVTVPESGQPEIDPGAVAKILDSISTDLGTTADTVVSATGEFRIGALRGRHAKPEAEHVGVTARRAAMKRRRIGAERDLAAAAAVLEATELDLVARAAHIEQLQRHRDALPTTRVLDTAQDRALEAEVQLDEARGKEREAATHVRTADEAHAAAVSEATRLAGTHQLPIERHGLMGMRETIGHVATLCREANSAAGALSRSQRDWHARADDWRVAREVAQQASTLLATAGADHSTRAMRLATLEDAIGTEYQEVLASLEVSRNDLSTAKDQLTAAHEREKAAIEGRTNAERDADEADTALNESHERCVAAIDPMRRALAVPGLLDAALASGPDGQAPYGPIPPVEDSPAGAGALAQAVIGSVGGSEHDPATSDGVRQSLRQRREQLGAGWDAEDHQPDDTLPMSITVTGPLGRMPLAAARAHVRAQHHQQSSLLTTKQDQALRNLLQGLVAREVAEKMHAAGELIGLMNQRLENVTTAHGIGARLTWKRRTDLDPELTEMIDLLRRPPDLRTADHDAALAAALSTRIGRARRDDPERRYRDLIAEILDYRDWHDIGIVVRRAGRDDERLTRRTPLSEGEKKIVSYLPLFAAVAGSCDALAESDPAVPRFVLLDDAFAKVSEDNHAQLFGLLVELDLDFIATSERLWGTHATVPELAITEVLRDASLGVIVLEHSRWNGRVRAADDV